MRWSWSNREPLGRRSSKGGVEIKKGAVGRWSSKGCWGGGHQKGADWEVVIRRELVGRLLSKGC